MYEGIYSELSSEEEVEIMTDENCREYSENDYVSLKNGGEGRIVKIIYVVMDNEEEIWYWKYHYKRPLKIRQNYRQNKS